MNRSAILLLPLLALLVVGVAPPATAESYSLAEVEILTLRRDSEGFERNAVFTVSGAYGFRAGGFMAYAGAGLGFFTVQARLGVAYAFPALHESGPMVRFEVRPQILVFTCGEIGFLGNVGAGYRWELEDRLPYEGVGPALYVLPAFDGGPAWIRPGCSKGRIPGDLKPTILYGGTVALGLDW